MAGSGLTQAQRAFLEEKRFAVVGSRNPDGSPHLAVMWYLLDGDDVVVNSAQGRIKDRNLAADPRMSVLVEDGYRWIRIEAAQRSNTTSRRHTRTFVDWRGGITRTSARSRSRCGTTSASSTGSRIGCPSTAWPPKGSEKKEALSFDRASFNPRSER